MPQADLHEGEVGTVITLTFKDRQTGAVVDLTGYTISIVAAWADGTRAVWAGVVSDAEAGRAAYTTTDTDLDRSGYLVLQGEASKSGQLHPADPVRLYVGERLRAD